MLIILRLILIPHTICDKITHKNSFGKIKSFYSCLDTSKNCVERLGFLKGETYEKKDF